MVSAMLADDHEALVAVADAVDNPAMAMRFAVGVLAGAVGAFADMMSMVSGEKVDPVALWGSWCRFSAAGYPDDWFEAGGS